MVGTTTKRSRLDWRDIFPFEPYDQQEKGILAAREALGKNGVFVFEGPCGTGKTLIALTAGLSLIADPDTKFKRILVVTSKKQQIRAFEDDLASINDHGCDFQGLTLVGKGDVCPFVHSGAIDSQEIYHRCDELKESTDRLMRKAVAKKRVDIKADAAYGLTAHAKAEEEPLSIDGARAPYQQSIPTAEGEEYCPFFAQHFVNDYENNQPVEVDKGTTAVETMQNGTVEGTCPHMAMKKMATDGDVLIGNYAHAFAPLTVEGFTGRVMNNSTLLIVDEAHELVDAVRDELSQSVSMGTLHYAVRDTGLALKWLAGHGHHRKASLVQKMEERGEWEGEKIHGLKFFLDGMTDLLTNRITEFLEAEYGPDWMGRIGDPTSLEEHSIPIQNESGEEGDILERWVSRHGEEGDWVQALYMAYTVGSIRDAVSRKVDQQVPRGDFAITRVRELLHRWLIGDHVEYFRELLLVPREAPPDEVPPERPWEAGFRANLRVNNCIPEKEVAATIDAFGGAILQSATLEPMDVYTAVTGVDRLAAGTQPSSSLVTKAAARYQDSPADTSPSQNESKEESPDTTDEPDPERQRHVRQETFKTTFPPANRASFAVDLPKFTYGNRWPPEDSQDVRAEYASVITSVARTTPGNVIVFMPSYGEGKWASKVLEESSRVDKPILTDRSSSDAETEALKRKFIAGPPKVLTTGLRGTLVEGVDFSGDKLHGAVICGVPIAPTGSKLADSIQKAYAYRFGGSNAFEYAYTVPAIRKTRQALGRVIRGTDDVGVRVVADSRYARDDRRTDVREHLPAHVRDEFVRTEAGDLEAHLQSFWSTRTP